MFLIANQAEEHIFRSNHKIRTFLKKKSKRQALWNDKDILTAGISCSFSFLFKSYFIFHKKMENFDSFKMSHNFWPCSQMHRLCYTVTCNSPGHERPGVCFQEKVYFITEHSIILFSSLFYHSNDWECSDIKGLANRKN